jgi:hypothetical protein
VFHSYKIRLHNFRVPLSYKIRLRNFRVDKLLTSFPSDFMYSHRTMVYTKFSYCYFTCICLSGKNTKDNHLSTLIFVILSSLCMCELKYIWSFITILYIYCMLVPRGGNMKIYSPKSIIFPEGNARGEYDARGRIHFHISCICML